MSEAIELPRLGAQTGRFQEETELNAPNVITRIQAELDDLLTHYWVDDSDLDA